MVSAVRSKLLPEENAVPSLRTRTMPHGGVVIDHRPDFGEVSVHLRSHRIQLRRVKNQVQHAFLARIVAECAAKE